MWQQCLICVEVVLCVERVLCVEMALCMEIALFLERIFQCTFSFSMHIIL